MCQHGELGYCWDDSTPEERETYDILHRHAYTWALPAGRDEAEAYAAAYATENYRWGLEEAPMHTRERYEALMRP